MGKRPRPGVLAAALVVASMSGCASLGQLGQLGSFIQPLHFSTDRERPAELQLGSGMRGLPTSALLTMWARVENPNPFGLTLANIDGTVFLDDTRAASVSLPLGLPLEARTGDVIPIEVSIRLSDLPQLGGSILRAVTGDAVPYRLEGSFSVEAGGIGSPSFGPMTLLTGEVRPPRR